MTLKIKDQEFQQAKHYKHIISVCKIYTFEALLHKFNVNVGKKMETNVHTRVNSDPKRFFIEGHSNTDARG